jgi:hypothetical protein
MVADLTGYTGQGGFPVFDSAELLLGHQRPAYTTPASRLMS